MFQVLLLNEIESSSSSSSSSSSRKILEKNDYAQILYQSRVGKLEISSFNIYILVSLFIIIIIINSYFHNKL